MGDVEDIALKIFYAFEDLYFEKDKGKIFDDVFERYFSFVEIEQYMDVYDVLVSLGINHRKQFDEMVKELKSHSIISG